MLKVVGENTFYQIDQKVYGRNSTGKKDERIFTSPHDSKIDLHNLLSYSVYAYHSVYVQNDFTAYALGDNRNGQVSKFLKKEIIEEPTPIQIFKVNKETLSILSAVCCTTFTIYLTKLGSSENNLKLLYLNSKKQNSQIFLDTKTEIPVSLYGGNQTCAAINSNGGIIVITDSMLENEIFTPILATLPNNEKAIYIACCDKYILALTKSGKVYKSNISYSNTLSSFKEIDEVHDQKFIRISGTYQHSLLLTDQGTVYGQGSNSYCKLGLRQNITSVDKYTPIPSLQDNKIIDIYAGKDTSFFLSEKGSLFACGFSRNGELFMASGNSIPVITTPTESLLKEGVTFCVAGNDLSVAFIGCKPPKRSPNKVFNFSEDDDTKSDTTKDHPLEKKVVELQKKLELQTSSYEDQLEKKDQLISKLQRQLETASFDPYSDDHFAPSSEDNCFIDEDVEQSHEVITKIAEGATSVTYKIYDKKSDKVLCKKVLKSGNDQIEFKSAQNALKEFEILRGINHPCICRAIGINIQEPVEGNAEMKTVALFLEFLNYSLKDCIEKKILNNTLKTRIVIEIVHAMKFIHNHGMIHRDIKIENIMLNSVFEAKIVDFGLAKIDQCLFGNTINQESLTRGVGTLSYMSPEMINEEEYDNKTDVFSFGVVLFYLFVGNLPNYSMRDKMMGKPVILPKPSLSISKFCLDLIAKCLKASPNERPTFDAILTEINNNSYALASDVDTSIISKRDRELDFFEFKYKS